MPEVAKASNAIVNVELAVAATRARDEDYWLVEQLVNQASQRIETYCRNYFARRTETIQRTGNGGTVLDVGGVFEAVASITVDAVAVAETSYRVLPRRGEIHRAGLWAWGAAIEVVATVGAARVPADVERACFELVRAWYAQRDSDPTLRSERIGDYSYEREPQSIVAPLPLPQAVLSLLRPYRRLVL